MSKRLIVTILALALPVCAQRRVDPRNTYHRVIAIVALTGAGTPADPKRPGYAPWPASQDTHGIVAFTYLPSDDGKSAIAEFVAFDREAFRPLFNDRSIKVFEKGQTSRAEIESAVQPLRKDFNLDTFGMVMP